MEIIEKVEQYYLSISQFNGEEGFISILPGPESSDYEDIMSGLIDKTDVEIEELIELIKAEDISFEDKASFIEYLNELNGIKTILEEKRSNDLKEEEVIKEDIRSREKKILFASNSYGNYPAIQDLKDIFKTADEETKNSFYNMLNALKEDVTFDEEKCKSLSINNKLRGVFERKEYQSRLYYEYAAGCIVIIGANIKKTIFDKREQTIMISRKLGADDYINELKLNKGNKDYIMTLAEQTDAMLSNLTKNKSL